MIRLWTIPNVLTLCRVCVIPVIVFFLMIDSETSRWWAFIIYVFAGVTDFLDGYLARILKESSSFGRAFDPIADKLLIAATLLILTNNGIVNGPHIIPTLVILMREITISGLREFFAIYRKTIPVSKAAKWKTFSQITSLGFLILGHSSPVWIPSLLIGKILLWVTAILTCTTAYSYVRNIYSISLKKEIKTSCDKY